MPIYIIMTKEELLNQLEHTKNNYIVGLAAMSVFGSGQAMGLLEHHSTAFGDYTVTFDQLARLLKNERDSRIVLAEFNKMLMRTTIKESFEHIKDYCQSTDQYVLLKAEPWYEFARIIRNFLSHNCRFIFNKFDRERLPIRWRDFEITEALHGRGLSGHIFGNVETWELFQQFVEFASQKLR
ncbi:MAG: hypothetical protein WCZ89_01045 [Phycisphaerae bacterium]